MVRPAEDEATLRNLANEPLDKLRPEFKEALERLKHKVFSAVRPKAVNGRALSGKRGRSPIVAGPNPYEP